jgi:hypothetical protein
MFVTYKNICIISQEFFYNPAPSMQEKNYVNTVYDSNIYQNVSKWRFSYETRKSAKRIVHILLKVFL